MLTIQVITKNNIKTIGRCLESAVRIADEVVVGDLGSEDGTLEACRDAGARVVEVKFEGDFSEVRNSLLADGQNMYLEPWEAVVRGGEAVRGMEGCFAFYVAQRGFVSKQVRLWRQGVFTNPAFERVSGCGDAVVRPDVVVLASGAPDTRRLNTSICRSWAEARITSPEPHYYLACSLLAEGRLEDFMGEATKYLSMDAEGGESSILMNYYLASVELHRGMVAEASRRVLGCIGARPTFAEFWCLLGDMFYRRGKFPKAMEIYENARLIGSRRRNDDMYPIEISKYGEYPRSMEEKCRKSMGESLTVARNSPKQS